MIGNYVTGRTAVFIDAANILYSQKTLGWRVDYKKLNKYFHAEAKIQSMRFYYGLIKENEGQMRFFQMLRDEGYIVCTKEVKYIHTNKGKVLKGNLDIEMAIDMIELQQYYDTAVILSGDSDFDIVLQKLKQKGKKVITMSSRGHVSRELARNASKYVPIEKLKESIERI